MFNDDQVGYMRSLGKRSPAELCWCGWYPKGECPSCPPDKTGLDKKLLKCQVCGNGPDNYGAGEEK